MNMNLLKGQELPKFNKKDNYEVWIDSVKNDLYSVLPEAERFVKYVVETTDLTSDIIKKDIKRMRLPHQGTILLYPPPTVQEFRAQYPKASRIAYPESGEAMDINIWTWDIFDFVHFQMV